MQNYYSALDKTDTSLQYPAVDVFAVRGSIAFQADIMQGLHEYFDECDILYAEPPWVDGYGITQERAGTNVRAYRPFIEAIGRVISQKQKPTIIIIGISHKEYLPYTNMIYPVKLNGYKARAFCYNIDPVGLDFNDCPALIASLAKRYNKVGDFCCGYGNTGKIFFKAGKEFVMCDINPRCIGFIKQSYASIPKK